MDNKLVDSIVNKGKSSLGIQYMEWLDTKPKVFLSFVDWKFTYNKKE